MEVRHLKADEIEVKVKQVTSKGVFALLYKTARTDMALLDESFGESNWRNDYKEVKGNLFCGIAVYFKDTQEWVWRWDCGIESREDDGNEKKGEASDSFKRAGTRWGIGRELYTAPPIFIKAETVEVGKSKSGKPTYALADKFLQFYVQEIGYDENRKINKISISDSNGNIVFNFPQNNVGMAKPQVVNKQTKVPDKTAPNTKDKVKKAMDTVFEFGGKEYRLGDLSEEWLMNNKDRERYTAIKPQIEILLKAKYTEKAKSEEETPFDVKG